MDFLGNAQGGKLGKLTTQGVFWSTKIKKGNLGREKRRRRTEKKKKISKSSKQGVTGVRNKGKR